MADFLHIFVTPKKDVTREKVEEVLNKAVDWFRYYGGVYVVYTTSSVETWETRLLDLVKPDGSLFICKLDIKKRKGWMTKEFWNWIKSKKEAV
jgi:hypothetical protein